MKKAKFISTIIIFVLLLSVLCTGVYSASQFTISILGDLSIIPADLSNENVVSVKNSSNLNVSIACLVENGAAGTTASKTISKSGKWRAGELSFATTMYGNGELRLKTIKMKMLVTNTDSVPVSVTIDAGDANSEQNSSVKVTTIENAYIAPGDTGEVSVQFSAVYDRSSSTVKTAPEIATYNYTVTVSKATKTVSSTYVYDLITYDNDTSTNSMPTKGFNYYIEYGDNPYVPGTKLRWYVWAKDDGNGNPTALEDGDKITDNGVKKLAKNNTYYFISEYVLDSSSSQHGISFQSEIYMIDDINVFANNTNIYGDSATDYSASNVREYLNGLTVKNSYYDNTADDSTYNQYMPNGSDVNFLNTYNLTNDPLYTLIVGRSLESLYGDMGNYDDGDNTSRPFPTKNTDAKTTDTDIFWLLSSKEYSKFIVNRTSSNGIAYKASQAGTRTTSTISYWWLRGAFTATHELCVNELGSWSRGRAYSYDHGVRPAFKLQI